MWLHDTYDRVIVGGPIHVGKILHLIARELEMHIVEWMDE